MIVKYDFQISILKRIPTQRGYSHTCWYKLLYVRIHFKNALL